MTTMLSRTRITIDRKQLRALLEDHLREQLAGPHVLHEFTISRNGSIEMVVDPVASEEAPGDELKTSE